MLMNKFRVDFLDLGGCKQLTPQALRIVGNTQGATLLGLSLFQCRAIGDDTTALHEFFVLCSRLRYFQAEKLKLINDAVWHQR